MTTAVTGRQTEMTKCGMMIKLRWMWETLGDGGKHELSSPEAAVFFS
jgi:hypothetical protein